jgi:AraC-like DNA-binding protein
MTPRKKLSAAAPEDKSFAELIMAFAPYDGLFPMRLPGIFASRFSRPNKDMVRGLQQPALCLVAQGSKLAMLGSEVFRYNANRMIVFSLNMPLAFQVTGATPSEPYLGLRIDLDPRKIADLVLKVYPSGVPRSAENRAVILSQSDRQIQDAAMRLLRLLSNPEDASLLGPLAIDEILIRLLRSPIGPRVAQMGFVKSGLPGVAKAVTWLCDNFSQPMKVEELVHLASMGSSAFHQHFKAVTSMSPLQYQKVLRLQEARRLMLSGTMDAGEASQQVGYVSSSQFSREYGRLFGNPPTKDITQMRVELGVGESAR